MIPFMIATMAIIFLSVIITWFFIIYDIIHIARREDFSSGMKVGWVCAIWFLNIFTIPIYAFKYFK